MQRRQGAGPPQRDEYEGQHTYGHSLLNIEYVRKLADSATHWAIVIHFENEDQIPNHNLFPSAGVISLFEQGKLCRASLLAGFKTKREPHRPVPACFFRTLDYLLQHIAAGNVYRPINDKEEAKGFPPAGWCRPPVVAASEDAAAATAAALADATPAALERAPATDPIRLFYSSRCWCYVFSFHVAASTVRVAIGATPAEMYAMYLDGALSEYALMVGLSDSAPPSNLWVPPCVMMPFGALLYMHSYGRPYLPISLQELKATRSSGLFSLGSRSDVRPLPLPDGVLPPPPPLPPGMDAEPPRQGGGSGGAASAGASAAASGASSRTMSRANSVAPVAAAAGSGSGTAAAAAGGTDAGSSAARGGGGGGGGGSSGLSPRGATPRPAAAAPPPPPKPDPEPDPILNSSNWIMPQPFDTPTPPSASAAADAAGGGADANGRDGQASPLPAVAALQPSPFLGDYNYGVQPTFETPPLRLFLGERGQTALAANWWFVDAETNAIRGPHSPEQMTLSYVAGCRELHEETLVCGTEPDVRPPMAPPMAAFLPLRTLLGDIMESGVAYALVTRADIVSPLAQRFLGNRIRPAKPAAPAPVPAPPAASVVPLVSAIQAAASAQQQQQQRPESASSGSVSGGVVAAPAGPAVSPAPTVTVQVLAPQPPQPVPATQPAPPQPAQPPQPHVVSQQQPQQQPPSQPPQPPAAAQATPPAPPAPLVMAAPVGLAPPQPVQHVPVRPFMLPPHLAGPRPRPVAPGPAPMVPMVPGPMMFMQGYGNMAPYNGPPVVVQPVLGAMPMQPPPPPPHHH